MKGTRWSFGDKLRAAQHKFIYIPQEVIGIKYKIVELLSISSFGETFRIKIQVPLKDEKEQKPKFCASEALNNSDVMGEDMDKDLQLPNEALKSQNVGRQKVGFSKETYRMISV